MRLSDFMLESAQASANLGLGFYIYLLIWMDARQAASLGSDRLVGY